MPRSRRVAKMITDGKIKGIITQAKSPEQLKTWKARPQSGGAETVGLGISCHLLFYQLWDALIVSHSPVTSSAFSCNCILFLHLSVFCLLENFFLFWLGLVTDHRSRTPVNTPFQFLREARARACNRAKVTRSEQKSQGELHRQDGRAGTVPCKRAIVAYFHQYGSSSALPYVGISKLSCEPSYNWIEAFD